MQGISKGRSFVIVSMSPVINVCRSHYKVLPTTGAARTWRKRMTPWCSVTYSVVSFTWNHWEFKVWIVGSMGWRKTLTPLLAHCVSKTILYLSDKHYIIFYVKSCVNCLTFCIICVTCQPALVIFREQCTAMMASSNGNIFRVTWPLCGEFTGSGEFPTQRPVTRSLDVFFDLRLDKRLSKQPWGWWYETQSWSLWRHCNEVPVLSTKTWSSLCTGQAFYNTERRHVTKNNIGLKMLVFWPNFHQWPHRKLSKWQSAVQLVMKSGQNYIYPYQWSTVLTVTYFFKLIWPYEGLHITFFKWMMSFKMVYLILYIGYLASLFKRARWWYIYFFFHYRDIICAALRLKSPTNRLFVQQLSLANNK